MSENIERRKPQVNEVNEFLEIASDFENPLELIREALSNSYDARAKHVEITIDELSDGRTRIRIEDDGNGMDEAELASFFDLGNSQKGDEGIGYKGHGTKIYYKSDQVTVQTAKDGVHYQAVMSNPWQKLNNRELPTYRVESRPGSDDPYTSIEIVGFRSGKGFSRRNLTYNRLDHYINWKTIGGSLAPLLDEPSRQMKITVELDEEIDDTQNKLVQYNHFNFPTERTDFDAIEDPEKMCKHYPPNNHKLHVNGEEYSVSITGFVAGKQAREELPTYGKHSTQFGVWLAKDQIKVERANDVIGSDHEKSRFFFVANCQALELSANRETIRNKSSAVYDALIGLLNRFMTRVTEDRWYRKYLEVRQAAEQDRTASSQAISIEQRKERLAQEGYHPPTNGPELVAALTEATIQNSSIGRIVDYEPDDDIEVILANSAGLEAAALTIRLHQLFEEERTIREADRIICWSFGDIDRLHQLEREGYFGRDLEFRVTQSSPACVVDDTEIQITELESQSGSRDIYDQ